MGCPATCTGCGRNAGAGNPRCSSPGNPLYWPHAFPHHRSQPHSRRPAPGGFAAAPRAHIIPNPIRQYPVAAQAGAADAFAISPWSGTMKDKLIIFDTTMRDGEQSPGASMTKEEKLRIARLLERMRVDVIEAGFPASSNGDFEAVQAGLRQAPGATGLPPGPSTT